MDEDITTQCLMFPELFDRPVVVKFDQQQGSSDGGALLLKAANQRLGLTSALSACLEDGRQAGKVQHTIDEILIQRVMAIACGYEDANDAARLASDQGPTVTALRSWTAANNAEDMAALLSATFSPH